MNFLRKKRLFQSENLAFTNSWRILKYSFVGHIIHAKFLRLLTYVAETLLPLKMHKKLIHFFVFHYLIDLAANLVWQESETIETFIFKKKNRILSKICAYVIPRHKNLLIYLFRIVKKKYIKTITSRNNQNNNFKFFYLNNHLSNHKQT